MRPGPPNSKFDSMSFSLIVANFFQSILFHKNWLGGSELLLKNVQSMVTPTNHVIASAGFTLNWNPVILRFFQYFSAKYCIGEDQKKSYERGPLALGIC